jgi:transcriptional regulator with XRE-family HTH domain
MPKQTQLARLRTEAGLTQRDMATLLKTSQPWVCRLEANPDAATVRSLRRYLSALGYDLAYVPAINGNSASL